jgi:hypothetical protein
VRVTRIEDAHWPNTGSSRHTRGLVQFRRHCASAMADRWTCLTILRRLGYLDSMRRREQDHGCPSFAAAKALEEERKRIVLKLAMLCCKGFEVW